MKRGVSEGASGRVRESRQLRMMPMGAAKFLSVAVVYWSSIEVEHAWVSRMHNLRMHARGARSSVPCPYLEQHRDEDAAGRVERDHRPHGGGVALDEPRVRACRARERMHMHRVHIMHRMHIMHACVRRCAMRMYAVRKCAVQDTTPGRSRRCSAPACR